MKSKIIRPKAKDVKLLADCLWSELVKANADYKSEYSGIEDQPLNSHHILGKKTLSLRYSLSNGVCLTAGEHKFIAHSPDGLMKWRRWLDENFDESDIDYYAYRTPLYALETLSNIYISFHYGDICIRPIATWPAYKRVGRSWRAIDDYYQLGLFK